jgi:UDP-N-acetylmuramoylalanine--D-glutamate ligase
LIGKTAKNIEALIKNIKGENTKPMVYLTKSLEASVQKASYAADKGDIVLLSPACASYGMFTNYEERGKRFKEFVNSL